jgi:hypothetical protein
MYWVRGLTATGLVLAAGLVSVSTVRAGPVADWFSCGDSSEYYSPARYWAPGAARVYDKCHGPKLSVYAPDRHPEIPATCIILKYPCRFAAPATTIIASPTPPATSAFHY